MQRLPLVGPLHLATAPTEAGTAGRLAQKVDLVLISNILPKVPTCFQKTEDCNYVGKGKS